MHDNSVYLNGYFNKTHQCNFLTQLVLELVFEEVWDIPSVQRVNKQLGTTSLQITAQVYH